MIKNKTKIKQLFVEQLSKTPIIQVCCDKLNVSRATFYRMKASDKKFSQEVDKALDEGRELVNDIAESRLLTAIQNGNLSSIMYWLKFNNSRYGNKIEISGSINTTNELTPQQLKNIKKALALANIKENNYERTNK